MGLLYPGVYGWFFPLGFEHLKGRNVLQPALTSALQGKAPVGSP